MLKKILVVEDQQEIRRLIRMTLELESYSIEECATADEGAHVFQSLRPDLVLLDVMTPGAIDGLDLCRLIKQDEGGDAPSPPVILLTARGRQADVESGLAAGADAYLIKPFSPLELLETVKQKLLHAAGAAP